MCQGHHVGMPPRGGRDLHEYRILYQFLSELVDQDIAGGFMQVRLPGIKEIADFFEKIIGHKVDEITSSSQVTSVLREITTS